MELKWMRSPGCKHNDSAFFMPLVRKRPPETISNMCICLIKHTDFMLYKQLETLSKDFLKNGGMRERMTRWHIEQGK